VGYEAARLLDRLLDGEPAPDAPILLPPTGVTTRASTRALAIEDPDVRAAVAYIEAHAAEPISAADIVAQTMLTRCTLEKRFARVRGNSVHEELLRTRLRIARHLLIETELRTDEVARRAGFRWAAYLCEAFTREMGLAPSRYRAQFGLAPCGGEGPTS
jgi:LacI family transcriptional regulator